MQCAYACSAYNTVRSFITFLTCLPYTAELIIGQILNLARQLGDRNMEMHRGVWNKTAKNCREIRGKTLGKHAHVRARARPCVCACACMLVRVCACEMNVFRLFLSCSLFFFFIYSIACVISYFSASSNPFLPSYLLYIFFACAYH